MRRLLIAALIAVTPWCAASAQDHASATDAQMLLDKAAEHYRSVGRDQAFADFAMKEGPFFYRDLYVYCDRDGTPPVLSFHPIAKALVNKSIEHVVDSEGKPYGTTMLHDALEAGTAQVDYAWPDPLTKKIQRKTALATKVAPDEVCAVGYYH